MVIVIIANFGLVKYDDWIYLAPVISLVSWLDLFIGLVIIKSFGDYSGIMINFIWPMIIRDYHYFPSLGHWLFLEALIIVWIWEIMVIVFIWPWFGLFNDMAWGLTGCDYLFSYD